MDWGYGLAYSCKPIYLGTRADLIKAIKEFKKIDIHVATAGVDYIQNTDQLFREDTKPVSKLIHNLKEKSKNVVVSLTIDNRDKSMIDQIGHDILEAVECGVQIKGRIRVGEDGKARLTDFTEYLLVQQQDLNIDYDSSLTVQRNARFTTLLEAYKNHQDLIKEKIEK